MQGALVVVRRELSLSLLALGESEQVDAAVLVDVNILETLQLLAQTLSTAETEEIVTMSQVGLDECLSIPGARHGQVDHAVPVQVQEVVPVGRRHGVATLA